MWLFDNSNVRFNAAVVDELDVGEQRGDPSRY
jgi:hypothetical protein